MPKATNTANGGDTASGKSKKKEILCMICNCTTSSLAALVRSHSTAAAFASDLRRRLPTDKDDSAASQALLAEVQRQTQSIDRYSDKPYHGMLHDEDLDAEGTKLWNVCTRLGRENAARTSAGLKLVLWSRVLALHILHLCQWSTKCTTPVASHLMGLALRVAKLCTGPHPSVSLL